MGVEEEGVCEGDILESFVGKFVCIGNEYCSEAM